MNNKDVHKFYKYLKSLPEYHTLMKELLLEYLRIREENEALYQDIEFLEQEIEKLNTQELIH